MEPVPISVRVGYDPRTIPPPSYSNLADVAHMNESVQLTFVYVNLHELVNAGKQPPQGQQGGTESAPPSVLGKPVCQVVMTLDGFLKLCDSVQAIRGNVQQIFDRFSGVQSKQEG